MKELQFKTIGEIKTLIRDSLNPQIVIWGSGEISRQVRLTLETEDIPIACYGDSRCTVAGYKDGIAIRPIEELREAENLLVIIGSYAYIPIYKFLKGHGIRKVYALLDAYKYDYQEMLLDRADMAERNERTEGNACLLVELYGNIGDTIMQFGIVSTILRKYGKGRVWLLLETQENAAAYRTITDHILVCSAGDCVSCPERRRNVLHKIHQLGIRESIVLSDVRLYAVRRWLNTVNAPDIKVHYNTKVPDTEYLVALSERFVADTLGIGREDILRSEECWRDIPLPSWKDRLSESERRRLIGKRIAAIHMGATKRERMYSPRKTAEIAAYIRSKDIVPVVIGAGETDEVFWREVSCYTDAVESGLYLVSRLTILESMSVIREADFFLGTDSGMWNAAVVLGKPSVVLYGGGEYGCFQHSASYIHYVTTDERDCFQCKWYCNRQDAQGHAKCIYEIPTERILEALKEVITGRKQ